MNLYTYCLSYHESVHLQTANEKLMGVTQLSREIVELNSSLTELARTVSNIVTTVFTPNPFGRPPGMTNPTLAENGSDQPNSHSHAAPCFRTKVDQSPFQFKLSGKKLFLTQFEANTGEYCKFGPIHGINIGSKAGVVIPEVDHPYRMLTFLLKFWKHFVTIYLTEMVNLTYLQTLCSICQWYTDLRRPCILTKLRPRLLCTCSRIPTCLD